MLTTCSLHVTPPDDLVAQDTSPIRSVHFQQLRCPMLDVIVCCHTGQAVTSAFADPRAPVLWALIPDLRRAATTSRPAPSHPTPPSVVQGTPP